MLKSFAWQGCVALGRVHLQHHPLPLQVGERERAAVEPLEPHRRQRLRLDQLAVVGAAGRREEEIRDERRDERERADGEDREHDERPRRRRRAAQAALGRRLKLRTT